MNCEITGGFFFVDKTAPKSASESLCQSLVQDSNACTELLDGILLRHWARAADLMGLEGLINGFVVGFGYAVVWEMHHGSSGGKS